MWPAPMGASQSAKIKEYYRRRVGEEGQGLQSDTDNEDRGPKLISPFHVVGLWSVAVIIEQNLFTIQYLISCLSLDHVTRRPSV